MPTETATLRAIQRRDTSLAAEIESLIVARSIEPAGHNAAGEPLYNVDLVLIAARASKAEGRLARGGPGLIERRAIYAAAIAGRTT